MRPKAGEATLGLDRLGQPTSRTASGSRNAGDRSRSKMAECLWMRMGLRMLCETQVCVKGGYPYDLSKWRLLFLEGLARGNTVYGRAQRQKHAGGHGAEYIPRFSRDS